MKRFSTGVLAAVFAAGFGVASVSAATIDAKATVDSFAPAVVAQSDTMPPADFGTPPSGEVPILYNDHHVYSKPDRLTKGRVLAALVHGSTILVPLRSMFEQMGATVSYDPASKTADVSKPGADIKVTVGRPEVVINGEVRPLDVPPQIYRGAVVVPIRVISEGMGAYVLWVPEKRVVVVRYVPAVVPTPPPTPVPTPVPTPKPTPKPIPPPPPPSPSPSPTPAPPSYEAFVVGDYVFSPKVYNEFAAGSGGTTGTSYSARGAIEFPAFNLPFMIEGDYRRYSYQHTAIGATNSLPCGAGAPDPAGCVTVIGGYSQAYVGGFNAVDTDFDVRLGYKAVDPRIYIGIGYLVRKENYGYPQQTGVGFGAEKLPDLDQPFSVYGSVWYYPTISANYTFPANAPAGFAGTTQPFEQHFLKYEIGGDVALPFSNQFGAFIDLGYLGDQIRGKTNSPSDGSHGGAYLGLGLKF